MDKDRLSDQVILIGATNHGEMLDRAVTRRFHHHLILPKPTRSNQETWISTLARKLPKIPIRSFDVDVDGMSFSDMKRAYEKACRHWALREITTKRITSEKRKAQQQKLGI